MGHRLLSPRGSGRLAEYEDHRIDEAFRMCQRDGLCSEQLGHSGGSQGQDENLIPTRKHNRQFSRDIIRVLKGPFAFSPVEACVIGKSQHLHIIAPRRQ